MSDLRFPTCRALPLALTLTLPFLPAQTPDELSRPLDPRLLGAGVSPIAPGAEGPGGLWAAGPDYKVSLHDGFVFLPYVGPTLPHQPLRWRTVAARLGDAELRSHDAAAPRWSARSCEYDLGGIVERYDLLERGVEQSFVITSRDGDGELVIEGQVDTPLELAPMPWQRAAVQLRLPDDGRAVIEYGLATAIDAGGTTFPVDTSCEGSTIRLRLAAEHVRAARFPLVVDPLISNVTIGAGATVTGADVLHETLTPAGSRARTWIAYSREVAAGDEDVWVVRVATGLNGTPIEVHREISAWSASHARLALAPDARKVVAVYSSGPVGPAAQRFLLIHSHLVDDLNLRTSTRSPFGTLVDNDWRPDVGGRLGSGSEVLVVWQRDAVLPFANTDTSAVWAGVYDAATDAASVAGFVVRNRPNQDQERPVVNQSADGAEWVLAFQSHDGRVANDDWDVTLLEVDALGTATTLGVEVDQEANPLLHKLGPRIAGADGRYCLVYTTQPFQLPLPKPQNILGRSIWAQRIDVDHATGAGSLPHPVVRLDDSNSTNLAAGGIAFDHVSASHFAVTTRDGSSGDCHARKLGYRGLEVESFAVDKGSQNSLQAGGVAFNGARREFLLSFGGDDGTANGNELLAALLTYDAVPPPATFGIGCGAGTFGGLVELESKQQIGAQGLSFVLQNAPFDGAGFLLLSTAAANIRMGPFGMPGCDLLVDPAPSAFLGLITVPVAGGTARVALDLPETLAPIRLAVQWLYPAPGANAAGMQASEGLDLSLAR